MDILNNSKTKLTHEPNVSNKVVGIHITLDNVKKQESWEEDFRRKWEGANTDMNWSSSISSMAMDEMIKDISKVIAEAENRHHAEKCQRRVFYQEGAEAEKKRLIGEVEKVRVKINKADGDYSSCIKQGINEAVNIIISLIKRKE